MSRTNWSSKRIFYRLRNNKSSQTYWDNIHELRKRPTKEVFYYACDLANSTTAKERRIGIDVLAQLGLKERPFKEETLNLFFNQLAIETDFNVINSLLVGIGHNNEDLKAAQLKSLEVFLKDKRSSVREGLVISVLGVEHKIAIHYLIQLSADKMPSIRNWATFGIGSLIEKSSDEIIRSLKNRLHDYDNNTRMEAILGLILRNVPEGKAAVLKELENDDFGSLIFQAIEAGPILEALPYLEKSHEISKQEKDVSSSWLAELEQCINFLKGIEHN